MGLFPIGLTLDDFLLFHSVSSKMVLNGASISTSTEKRRALNLYCKLTLKISPTILKDRIDEKICSSFTKIMVSLEVFSIQHNVLLGNAVSCVESIYECTFLNSFFQWTFVQFRERIKYRENSKSPFRQNFIPLRMYCYSYLKAFLLPK